MFLEKFFKKIYKTTNEVVVSNISKNVIFISCRCCPCQFLVVIVVLAVSVIAIIAEIYCFFFANTSKIFMRFS